MAICLPRNSSVGSWAWVGNGFGIPEQAHGVGIEEDTSETRLTLCAIYNAHRFYSSHLVAYITDTPVIDAINNGWLKNWAMNNWLLDEEPIDNLYLWSRIESALVAHTLTVEFADDRLGSANMQMAEKLAFDMLRLLRSRKLS